MDDSQLARVRRIHAERRELWATVADKWCQVDARIPVIAFARALDNESFGSWRLARTVEASGGLGALCHGWSYAITPFARQLSEHFRSEGTPLFVSDADGERSARDALTLCAGIRDVDSMLRTEDSASVAILAQGSSGASRSSPLNLTEVTGRQGYRDDLNDVRRHLRDGQRARIRQLLKGRPAVLGAMRKVTLPFKENFLSYTSTPQIQDWYFKLGNLVTERMVELSVVAPQTVFGGLPFRTYVEVVADEVAFALKHLDHCAVLHDKHPSLRWSNLLTITQDIEATLEIIQSRQGLSQPQAQQVVELLTWDASAEASNLELADGPCFVPPPPLIRTSANQHLRLLTGVLGEPVSYLYIRLKHAFPEEWAAAQPRIAEGLLDHIAGILNGRSKNRVRVTPGAVVAQTQHGTLHLTSSAEVEPHDVDADAAEIRLLRVSPFSFNPPYTCERVSRVSPKAS